MNHDLLVQNVYFFDKLFYHICYGVDYTEDVGFHPSQVEAFVIVNNWTDIEGSSGTDIEGRRRMPPSRLRSSLAYQHRRSNIDYISGSKYNTR